MDEKNTEEQYGTAVNQQASSPYEAPQQTSDPSYQADVYQQQAYQQSGYWQANQQPNQQSYQQTPQPNYQQQAYQQPGFQQQNNWQPNQQQTYQQQAYQQQAYQQQPNYQQPNYQAQGYQQPGSQPSMQPHYSQPVVPRDHVAAGLLAIFFGVFGIHKFYLGYGTQGFILLALSVIGGLLSFGIVPCIVWIVSIIEGIIYLTKTQSEFEHTYVYAKREWF